MKSPAHYAKPPLSGRSAGVARLTVPFYQLQRQFVAQFAIKVVKYINRGQLLADVQSFLEENGFVHSTIAMRELFQGYEHRPAQCDYSRNSIDQVQALAEDLSADDGAWREYSSVLHDAAMSQCTMLLSNLSVLMAKTMRSNGQGAVQQIANAIREKLRFELQELSESNLEVPLHDLQKMKQQLGYVRNLHTKCSWPVKLIRSFLPSHRIGFLYSHAVKRTILSLAKSVNSVQKDRFAIQCQRERIKALQYLLGTDGEPGALADIESAANRLDSVFRAIHGSLTAEFDALAAAPPSAIEIRLISQINEKLDPTSAETLYDLFMQLAAHVGCTPKKIAAAIFKKGLRLKGETRTPSDWLDLDPTQVSRGLLKLIERQFGCTDDVILHPTEPVTVADHLAQLSLLHPRLKRRLLQAIPQLLDRSKPYAEFAPMHEVEEIVQKFLYCFPEHRKMWVRLLSGDVAESSNASQYAMKHPYQIELLQVRVGGCIGSMPSFLRASVAACLAERDGTIPAHLDRHELPEMRLLDQRVREIADCRTLFNSGRSIEAISPVKDASRFALSRPDSRVHDAFAPRQWVAAELPAETIQHLLLNDARLTGFLVRTFPQQSDLGDVLRFYKNEDSALKLVEELVGRNVLIDVGGLYHVNATFTSLPMDAPRQIVRSKRGPLVGLSEQEFISELFKNDQLYCLVFFAVHDAFLLGQLSANHTPASVVEQAKSSM